MKSIIKSGLVLSTALLITISSFSKGEQAVIKNPGLLSAPSLLLSKKSVKGQVALIDKLFVPKNSIDEYHKQGNTIGEFIKKLPGLISQQTFEQTDKDGNINVVTIAIWENQEALDNARESVKAEFKRIKFDPGFFGRLNIKIERGIYAVENQ